MKLILRYGTVLLLLISAHCTVLAQKPTTPLELNDYFASINDTLYQHGVAWGGKLNSIFKAKTFDSLAPYRRRLEVFIETKQAELSKMKDIKGSENFRQAMLSFLAFEKKMIMEGFAPLEKFDSSSKDADVQAAIDHLTTLASSEKAKLTEVNTAQTAYAKANGFTIEEEE